MYANRVTDINLSEYVGKKCAMCIHTRANHNITPLQSRAERERDGAIVRGGLMDGL